MAVNHFSFNETSVHGKLLRKAINDLESGLEGLKDVIDVMTQMKETGTDGTQASHWSYATNRFEFRSDEDTLSAWNELNSAYSKLGSDATVDFVNSALLQLFSRLR